LRKSTGIFRLMVHGAEHFLAIELIGFGKTFI
jgi:hypothetical protein